MLRAKRIANPNRLDHPNFSLQASHLLRRLIAVELQIIETNPPRNRKHGFFGFIHEDPHYRNTFRQAPDDSPCEGGPNIARTRPVKVEAQELHSRLDSAPGVCPI